jgi:hypothetical protein
LPGAERENRTMSPKIALILAALFASTASTALAAPAASEAPSASASLQGDQSAWIKDPHIHAFYALTVTAFANGAAEVDRAKYERDSRAIFRDFGASVGWGADKMEDHLKLIPGQVIQIATEDPKVLSSYDAFIVAWMGPQ